MTIQSVLDYIKVTREAERKQRQLDRLQTIPLNYGIIRDLLRTASAGISVTVKLSDGTEILIKQDDAFDRVKRRTLEDLG